ncbi:MAG: hypothetical protein EHM68_16225 [Lysobacterales bacterium]|nr:MAG: hypothetical protein EHM68_16225 [Xanthomonadales bacterium]
MARKKHPNKAIEGSIRYAERHGWTLKPAGKSAHAFGILKCPHNDRDCRCGVFCQASIWSTPRSPEAMARQIRRMVANCIHQNDETD